MREMWKNQLKRLRRHLAFSLCFLLDCIAESGLEYKQITSF